MATSGKLNYGSVDNGRIFDSLLIYSLLTATFPKLASRNGFPD